MRQAVAVFAAGAGRASGCGWLLLRVLVVTRVGCVRAWLLASRVARVGCVLLALRVLVVARVGCSDFCLLAPRVARLGCVLLAPRVGSFCVLGSFLRSREPRRVYFERTRGNLNEGVRDSQPPTLFFASIPHTSLLFSSRAYLISPRVSLILLEACVYPDPLTYPPTHSTLPIPSPSRDAPMRHVVTPPLRRGSRCDNISEWV